MSSLLSFVLWLFLEGDVVCSILILIQKRELKWGLHWDRSQGLTLKLTGVQHLLIGCCVVHEVLKELHGFGGNLTYLLNFFEGATTALRLFIFLKYRFGQAKLFFLIFPEVANLELLSVSAEGE